jgi:hypothetical protein
MTGSFNASDEQGAMHRVFVYTDYDDDGHGGAAKGLTRLQLSDGRQVKRIAKGEYETADGQTKLRSNDPGAP